MGRQSVFIGRDRHVPAKKPEGGLYPWHAMANWERVGMSQLRLGLFRPRGRLESAEDYNRFQRSTILQENELSTSCALPISSG